MLKPIKRAVHFDFHTMPGIENFGEHFNAAAFARQMKDAHVEYINMFGRCNLGFSYYPTKVGVPYPTMKGNLLGDVVRECHKLGIRVTGYLNLGLSHEIIRRNPGWAKMTKDGKTYDFDTADKGDKQAHYFRKGCFNTGYGDHLVEEVKEILAQGVDGIFGDTITAYPCYCPKCLSDMKKMGYDFRNDADAFAFADLQVKRIAQRIRDVVPEDKYLFLNGFPFHYGLISHAEIECLPARWSYDNFISRAAYARPLYDKLVYMNGRFQTEWGDFGGYKSRASIENDFYDGLMNCATPMLGDHLHPAELAESEVYRELGEIYEEIMAYEKWTDFAKYDAEIAVLSDVRKLGPTHYGIGRLLSELKYTFNIVMTDGDFSAYKLVILPDHTHVDERLAAKLKDYLAKGGKVISTGTSGLTPDGTGFALPEWDFDYCGMDPMEISYFRMNVESREVAKNFRWDTYSHSMLMKAREGNTSLGEHITTYFHREFDGEHWFYYTPQKNETGYSIALVNGAENVAHIAFPLCEAYMENFLAAHRVLLGALIDRFLPDRLICADALPISARTTLTGTEDYKLFHVKVTYPELRGKMGLIDEHNVLPAGRVVAVKGEYTSVLLLPNETPVAAEVHDGYTYITLPEITGYAMFLLK